MINNVVFPHSVEVRPSFIVVRLKDESEGATTRIIVKFDLVKNFSLDAYGDPTIPNPDSCSRKLQHDYHRKHYYRHQR